MHGSPPKKPVTVSSLLLLLMLVSTIQIFSNWSEEGPLRLLQHAIICTYLCSVQSRRAKRGLGERSHCTEEGAGKRLLYKSTLTYYTLYIPHYPPPQKSLLMMKNEIFFPSRLDFCIRILPLRQLTAHVMWMERGREPYRSREFEFCTIFSPDFFPSHAIFLLSGELLYFPYLRTLLFSDSEAHK